MATIGAPLFFISTAAAPAPGQPPTYMAFWTIFGTSNQLLAALPKKGKGDVAMKRIITEAMAIPLQSRSVGQLIMLSCVAIRCEDNEAFQNIVNEILAREESLLKRLATATQKPDEKPGTELSEKEIAAAQASALKEARIEHCGIWIAVEQSTKLKQYEQAERLAKLALNGFEPLSIEDHDDARP